MTAPSIAVLPATADDLPRLVAASTSAFKPSLFDRRLFGGVSDDDYREMCTSMYASAIGHDGRMLLKAVLEREVVGFASWRLPGCDVKARKGLQYPAGTNLELAAEMFSQKPVEEPHFCAYSTLLSLCKADESLRRPEYARRRPTLPAARSWRRVVALGQSKGGRRRLAHLLARFRRCVRVAFANQALI